MLHSCPIRVTVIASFHLVKTVYVNIQVIIITETLEQIQLSAVGGLIYQPFLDH